MDELDGYRPLANSGSHSLHGTVPHVAYSEKAGNICLKEIWVSIERPVLWTLPLTDEIGACQDESVIVAVDEIREPVSSRQCANKNEHGSRRHALYPVRIGAKKRDFFQMRISVGLGHTGVRPNLDVWCFLDLVDQILRHGAR